MTKETVLEKVKTLARKLKQPLLGFVSFGNKLADYIFANTCIVEATIVRTTPLSAPQLTRWPLARWQNT